MAPHSPRRGARRRGGKSPVAAPAPTGLLVEALKTIHADLGELGARHALVGGLAVSARAEPRTTRDVDLAVLVEGDADAERLLFALGARGYAVAALIEQTRTKRLATARLRWRTDGTDSVIVDLLFASSGVEPEVVRDADLTELVPGVFIPVATTADLIALKVLARDDRTRPQDFDDLRALLAVSSASDRRKVAKLLELIRARGFGRGRKLDAHWQKALALLEIPSRRFRARAPPRR